MERAFRSTGLKEPFGLSGLVARAIRRNPDGRERLLRAWLDVAPPAGWASVLDALGVELPDSDAPVLERALASPDPAMREHTVWAIVVCTTDISIVASVHPALDVAAILAVSQWRFTPTLLDGKAVPVVATVTVNFTLQ